MPSETTVTAETLRTLHRIHQQLRDLKDRLSRGPRLAKAHSDNVAKLEARLAEVQTRAKSLKVATDNKQLQLKSGEEAVEKRRRQQREAKENREYQALKDQIAADEMANSVRADEILEAMEKLDRVNQEVAEAQAALKKGRDDAEKARKEFEETTPGVQRDAQRLEEELRRTEEQLPLEFRDVYRRLVRGKGEDALTPLVGEFCGGCNQHIPVNNCNDIMLSRPTFCRSCGRLLYMPEGGVPLARQG